MRNKSKLKKIMTKIIPTNLNIFNGSSRLPYMCFFRGLLLFVSMRVYIKFSCLSSFNQIKGRKTKTVEINIAREQAPGWV